MDSDDDAQSAAGGVRLTEQPVQRTFLPGGYTSGPCRQPVGPPESDILQQHAGFAKFLKTHLSPRHKRVTAGGRIVPAGPKSPPPTFHMDFIESIVKASEKADEAVESQPSIAKCQNSPFDQETTSKEKNTASLSSEPKPPVSQNEPPTTKSNTSQPTGTAPPRSAPILERLPPKYEVKELIDAYSAIVKAGTTILYASISSGNLALQTLEVVNPSERVTPLPTPNYGIGQFHPEMHAPHLLPNYQSMDGALSIPPQSAFEPKLYRDFAPRATPGPMAHGFQHPDINNGPLVRTDRAFHRNSTSVAGATALTYWQPLHDLGSRDIDTQISEIRNAHSQLKEEMHDLERYHALHADEMSMDEYRGSLNKKRQMVLELDRLRRLKVSLEDQRSAGIAVGTIDIPPRHYSEVPVSPIVADATETQDTRHRQNERYNLKKILSPEAPAFVPGHLASNARGNHQAKHRSGASYGHSFGQPFSNIAGTFHDDARFSKSVSTRSSASTARHSQQGYGNSGTAYGPWPQQGSAQVQQHGDRPSHERGAHMVEAEQGHIQAESAVRHAATAHIPGPEVSATSSVQRKAQGLDVEEMRALPMQRNQMTQYEHIEMERENAHHQIQMLEETFTWGRKTRESLGQHEARCKQQREIIADFRRKAEESAQHQAAEVDHKSSARTTNTPFVADKAYSRHGFLALKSPSTLASPVYSAAGLIPSVGNTAMTSFETATSQGQGPQTSMRGGAGSFHTINPSHGRAVVMQPHMSTGMSHGQTYMVQPYPTYPGPSHGYSTSFGHGRHARF